MYGNNCNICSNKTDLYVLTCQGCKIRAMKAVCNIRCKGFSNLFTMLNFEMLSKASSLVQMKITEIRKLLTFAKTLHDLTSLVYPVSCRNGNVTLETCYTIPFKYPFCRKRQKFPHPWNLLNL